MSSSAASSIRAALEIADRDERRDPPLERLGADLDVAQLLGDVAPLRQHVEDVAKRRRAAQPVGAAEHEREPLPVADPAGHGDRLVAHHRALVGPAGEGQRPAQSVQHAHTQLGVARIEGRPRLLEKLEGALVGDPHPPAGVLVADRGAWQALAVAQAPGDVGRCEVGVLRRPPTARRGTSPHRGRAGRPRDRFRPGCRARARSRSATAASSNARRHHGGGGREQAVLDRPIGAADRRGGGEVVGDVAERAGRP